MHVRASDLAGGAPAREVYRYLTNLTELSRVPGYREIGMGDESSAEWMPLLLPWNASTDGEFEPKNLLKKLGAHPHIQQLRILAEKGNFMQEFPRSLREFTGFLEKLRDFTVQPESERPILVFRVGRDELNPVPCFAVRLVRDDLVVGFIGGIVLT